MTLTNGNHAFAYNKNYGLPWHCLGTAVDGAMTWQEAMEKAGMNWSVSKRQLAVEISGYHRLVPAYGIFRDDNHKFLGVVGDQYTIIQNSEAFEFADSLLEQMDGSHYDTAGVLFNGERIFLSARIPFAISPDRAPNDVSHCHLMFETSHDGTMAATAKLTTVRVVCNNTLDLALGSKGFGTMKVRHSQSGAEKLERAKKMFSGVTQTVSTLKEKFDILSNRKINKEASEKIMVSLFGSDWKESTTKRNQIERIAHLFELNDRNVFPEIKGSAYAMLQSITNWTDHYRTTRKTDRMDEMNARQVQVQSAVFNGGTDFKSRALEIVMAATKDCPEMPSPKQYQSVDIPGSSKIDDILSNISI